MRRFNEVTLDVPGVKYFSWGAVFVPGILDLSLAYVQDAHFRLRV